MAQFSRRALTSYTLVIVFVFLSYVSYSQRSQWLPLSGHKDFVKSHAAVIQAPCQDILTVLPGTQNSDPDLGEQSALGPIRRRNVAISSVFGFHFDVYMALAWTLDRLRDRNPVFRLRVFADTFPDGFEVIIKKTEMYQGERYTASELLPRMREQDGDVIDLLILGTCEVESVSSAHSRLIY